MFGNAVFGNEFNKPSIPTTIIAAHIWAIVAPCRPLSPIVASSTPAHSRVLKLGTSSHPQVHPVVASSNSFHTFHGRS